VKDAGIAPAEVDPTCIEIGVPVRAVFERIRDGIHLPRWRLSSAA